MSIVIDTCFSSSKRFSYIPCSNSLNCLSHISIIFNHMMTRSTSVFLLFSLLLTIAAAPPAKKFKYKSVEGKMSLKFPAAYEVSEEPLKNGDKTVKISSTVGEQTYYAAYTAHSVSLDEPEVLTRYSLEAFNERVGGDIESTSDWEVKDSKGIIAQINMKAQATHIEYRALIRNNIQYQVLVVGPKGSWNQAGTEAFFKSFKVK